MFQEKSRFNMIAVEYGNLRECLILDKVLSVGRETAVYFCFCFVVDVANLNLSMGI